MHHEGEPLPSSEEDITPNNAGQVLLEKIEYIEDTDIAQFRSTLTPEWLEIFNTFDEADQYKLVALNALSPKQYDTLFDLASGLKLGHMVGIHKIGNLLTALEGIRMAQNKAASKAAKVPPRSVRKRRAA